MMEKWLEPSGEYVFGVTGKVVKGRLTVITSTFFKEEESTFI